MVERAAAKARGRAALHVCDMRALPVLGSFDLVLCLDDSLNHLLDVQDVRAALRGIAGSNPARLVLAVPLAPADSLGDLAGDCDEVVCLATPEPFYAVGAHYRDFTQTEDDEVIRLLAQARSWSREGIQQP
jgi:putative phosphoribosyl transferase